MEIFGKRPFVLKTNEMNGKIDAINIDAISKKIPSDCKILVRKVKDKLAEFFLNADFFKQVQEEASGVKKLFKKNKNLDLGEEELSPELNKLLNHFCFLDSRGNLRETLEKNLTEELVGYFETCTPADRGKVDHDDFVKKVGELEKKCREAKQKFKDKFEKVYKLLKSCIKKLEKRNTPEGIEEVLTSEIIDFKKYGIDLDKIIQKIKKAGKSIRNEGEDKSWEIIGSEKPEDEEEEDEKGKKGQL